MNPTTVVITGLGMVSPFGIGREAFSRHLTSPRWSPETPLLRIEDYDVGSIIQRKGLKYIGRGTRMVAAACRLALDDAKCVETETLGFSVGTAFGNTSETFNFTHRCLTDGVRSSLPMGSFDAALNSQTNYTAVYLESQSFAKTLCGMTASSEAMIEAVHLLQTGHARSAVVCGMDCDSEDLESWIRHSGRGGCYAEGSYAVVIERLDAALERGAIPLVEVSGYSQGFDSGKRTRELIAELADEALRGESADLVLSLGEPCEALLPTVPHLDVPAIAGNSLGARGTLGVTLATLCLVGGDLPHAANRKEQVSRVLLIDHDPADNAVAMLLRRFSAPE